MSFLREKTYLWGFIDPQWLGHDPIPSDAENEVHMLTIGIKALTLEHPLSKTHLYKATTQHEH